MAVTVRFDPELEAQIEERASIEHRSLNGLMVHAVQHYIEHTAPDTQVEPLRPEIAEQVRAAGQAYDV